MDARAHCACVCFVQRWPFRDTRNPAARWSYVVGDCVFGLVVLVVVCVVYPDQRLTSIL